MAVHYHPVVHFEIGCTDREKISTFYSGLFGWSVTDNGISAYVDTNSLQGINGHITSLGHKAHHYITMYIEVENIAEYVAKVSKSGGTPIAGPLDFANGQQFAWIKDPEGNLIGLIEARSVI